MVDKRKEGFVLWLTGLPCSGKTTIADKLAIILKERGRKIERLDGDIVRESLSSDLGFSKEDREENIKRVTFVCRLLSQNGIGVVTSFVSPYSQIRQKTRNETINFIEVFVDCSLSECRRRDTKGMYKLADEGKIKNFTGISAPYEAPQNPEVAICTDSESPEQNCAKIIKYLEDKRFL